MVKEIRPTCCGAPDDCYRQSCPYQTKWAMINLRNGIDAAWSHYWITIRDENVRIEGEQDEPRMPK